jgi:abelson tyrosine-protein kinase 1
LGEFRGFPIKWMAPETLSACVYSSSSDVWGLGVTFLEIIHDGSDPFPFYKSNQDYKNALVSQAFTPHCDDPDCPQELREIVDSIFVRKLSARPSAAAVAERLSEYYAKLQFVL